MESLGEIISRYRKSKKMSQPNLAEELTAEGFPTKVGALSTWETNHCVPNALQFLKVCKILGITDIYEEFIGENPNNMFSSLNDEGKAKALEYINLLATSGLYRKPKPEIIAFSRKLPLFDLPASAGPGSWLDGDGYDLIEVGREVPEQADFGIRVSGNSMTPRFLDKQIVWVQKIDTLQDGEFGIFFLDGNSYIKKLQHNAGGTTLISLNPAYAPIVVTEHSEFKIFGRVVG